MIYELPGRLCDAEALTATGYIGYCIDMASATQNLPGASNIWLAIITNVAGSSDSSDGTYTFALQSGTGTDGTDINAGASTIIQTPAIAEGDGRVDTAGDYILRCSVPFEMSAARYWQLYYTEGGTNPTITVDAILSIWAPRTNYNIQVTASPVGVP